jgi:cytoskeletal protein RodZ
LIQEQESIITQAAARGLQLSVDGRSWVPIHPEYKQVMVAEKEPSKYSVSSYFGASILGVVLGILLVVLSVAISVFALFITVYFFFILPISLLAGDYVSLGEFLSG